MREFTKENDGWHPRRRLAYIAKKALEIGGLGHDKIALLPLPGTTFTYGAPSGQITKTITGFPFYGGSLNHQKDVWMLPFKYESVYGSFEWDTDGFVSAVARQWLDRRDGSEGEENG